MKIPAQFYGHWSGEITDEARVRKYRGEITIDAEGMSATYHMSHGPKSGTLTAQHEKDGFLLVKDYVTSWSGTLLYVAADKNLKCVWRSGASFSSEATMTRIAPADTKQDGP